MFLISEIVQLIFGWININNRYCNVLLETTLTKENWVDVDYVKFQDHVKYFHSVTKETGSKFTKLLKENS